MPNADINHHSSQYAENLHQGHHRASFLALRYACKNIKKKLQFNIREPGGECLGTYGQQLYPQL